MKPGDLIVPSKTSSWPTAASYMWQIHPLDNPGSLETIPIDENVLYLLIEKRADPSKKWNWIRVMSPEGATGWVLIHRFTNV